MKDRPTDQPPPSSPYPLGEHEDVDASWHHAAAAPKRCGLAYAVRPACWTCGSAGGATGGADKGRRSTSTAAAA
eukprot:9195248-Pyramimonas_sp.AAC.1